MTLRLGPRAIRGLTVAWITGVWVALWGAPTAGTATAGALLGIAVVLGPAGRRSAGARPRAHATIRVSPVALLCLCAVFAVMLVVSTAGVVRLVLSRRLALRSAVLTVTLPPAPTGVVTLVANAVTLTPGTLALDAEPGPDGTTTLFVHALDAADAAAIRGDVLRLFALASAAFGPSSPATVRSTA